MSRLDGQDDARLPDTTDLGPALEIVMREDACTAGAAAATLHARARVHGLKITELATEIVRIDRKHRAADE